MMYYLHNLVIKKSCPHQEACGVSFYFMAVLGCSGNNLHVFVAHMGIFLLELWPWVFKFIYAKRQEGYNLYNINRCRRQKRMHAESFIVCQTDSNNLKF